MPRRGPLNCVTDFARLLTPPKLSTWSRPIAITLSTITLQLSYTFLKLTSCPGMWPCPPFTPQLSQAVCERNGERPLLSLLLWETRTGLSKHVLCTCVEALAQLLPLCKSQHTLQRPPALPPAPTSPPCPPPLPPIILYRP